MKVYLVGGAVRDQLLGRPVQDRDWVVVGSSPTEMRAAGYRQVGADFPVFLHPHTGEEYALARVERHCAPGHRGFVTDSGPHVTLEEDLLRRDLTINAIAMDDLGQIIDPWQGQRDLEQRVLRAVSPAFAEDPLRVFRVARFAAQLPGFVVADETVQLMQSMVDARRLAELPAERVWRELDKALHAERPFRFLEVLRPIGAFSPFFVEWLTSAPADVAGGFTGDAVMAIWCEQCDESQIRSICARLRVPNRTRDFVLRTHRAASVMVQWRDANADELMRSIERIRSFHEPEVAEAIVAFLERRYNVNLDDLRDVQRRLGAIGASVFRDLSGAALGAAIRDARLKLLVSVQRRR